MIKKRNIQGIRWAWQELWNSLIVLIRKHTCFPGFGLDRIALLGYFSLNSFRRYCTYVSEFSSWIAGLLDYACEQVSAFSYNSACKSLGISGKRENSWLNVTEDASTEGLPNYLTQKYKFGMLLTPQMLILYLLLFSYLFYLPLKLLLNGWKLRLTKNEFVPMMF